jgi:Flp pilus assembly protein TadB
VTGAGLAGLGGALAGAGLFCAVHELLVRAAPAELSAALARWDSHGAAAQPAGSGGHAGRWGAVLTGWAASPLLLGVPARDLALTGTPAEQVLLQRITAAAIGLAAPVLLWVLAGLVGGAPPVAVTGLAALGLAVGLSFVPVLVERQHAAGAREAFRAAVSALLDLVAQERAGGRSPVQALAEAATISGGPAFTRIRQALVQAQRTGTSPWAALSDLGARVGVAELADLADIAASAADGAAVYTTLTKKAAAVRAATLAGEQARANADSERLVLPVALLGLGFLLLLFYPAFIRLLTA